MQHIENYVLESPRVAGQDFSAKLNAEAQLLSGLPASAGAGMRDRLEHAGRHPEQLAAETACFATAGCLVGALTKNPAMLGEAVAPLVVAAGNYLPKYLLMLGAADATAQVALPAYETWRDPLAMPEAQRRLGTGIANATFDLLLAGTAGGAGAALSRPLATQLEAAGSALSFRTQPRLAFDSATTAAVPEVAAQPSAGDDFLLLAKEYELGGAPQKVTLSGVMQDNPKMAPFHCKPGDVVYSVVEQTGDVGTLGNRFFLHAVVPTPEGLRRRVLDLYSLHLEPLLFGMNAPHLLPKKRFLKQLIQSTKGKEFTWSDNGYQHDGLLLLPKDVPRPTMQPFKLTKEIQIDNERPMKLTMDKTPKAGDVWIRKNENSLSLFASNGFRWCETDLEPRFSVSRYGFTRPQDGHLMASELRLDLLNYGQRLVRPHGSVYRPILRFDDR